eukprot:954087_1
MILVEERFDMNSFVRNIDAGWMSVDVDVSSGCQKHTVVDSVSVHTAAGNCAERFGGVGFGCVDMCYIVVVSVDSHMRWVEAQLEGNRNRRIPLRDDGLRVIG